MKISPHGARVKYAERPPSCPDCHSPAWWNGSRTVSSVVRRGDSIEHRTDIVRRRACCSCRDCPRGSWTIYEEDSYPHRLFRLLVVVSAVSVVVFGGITMTVAARAHQCSRDSIRRWIQWVARLADPRQLLKACTQLCSDGFPGAFVSGDMPPAGTVLHLLDRFVELLTRRGVRLPGFKSGLVCILKDQLVRFGEVYYLTKPSPPLRADLAGIRL
jgi:hypothetical protein